MTLFLFLKFHSFNFNSVLNKILVLWPDSCIGSNKILSNLHSAQKKVDLNPQFLPCKPDTLTTLEETLHHLIIG